jgi:phosphoenolpyruvate carboxykinase (ATP)
VLPMHCSANVGKAGGTAIFFGLSGTGKTTLSTDPDRMLIGDDEHGWSSEGVFNFEGGCYAKAINLSAAAEPEIYGAACHWGTVLENVVVDPDTRLPDFSDASLTENTRLAYPLTSINNASREGTAAAPRTIIMLTADAFGVLPPIARLTPEQAMQYFLQGYTAKVAGTERGLKEPKATFSACFGAPFLTRHPTEYGDMLRLLIANSKIPCFLVNTGWTGGAYGVGKRFPIAVTRRLVNAALSGELNKGIWRNDEVFGFEVPAAVAGVEAKQLDPRLAWADASTYDAAAKKLRGLFEDNAQQFSGPATHRNADA